MKAVIDQATAKTVGWYTLICMCIAHAYRFFTLGYTNDSVAVVQSVHKNWKIELGRIFQPMYWEIRGDIVAPFLIGLLTTVYLAMAIYIIVKMLGIAKRMSIAMICMLLSTNVMMNYTTATWLHELDGYMLAFLLAVICVAVWNENKLHPLFRIGVSSVFLCMSVGIYQSYFQAAVLLFLIVLCKKALDAEKPAHIVSSGIGSLIILVIGLALYGIAVKEIRVITGISEGGTYNSLSQMKNFDYSKLPVLLMETYVFPIRWLANVEAHHPRITSLLYLLLLVLTGVLLWMTIYRRKLTAGNTVLAVLAVLLMPLGMNVVHLISNGLTYEPMVFSYYVVFVLGVFLLEKATPIKGMGSVQAAACVMTTVIFFNNTVYAHQLYLRRDLEFQSTLSLMTRIIERAEQTEGYKPGVTPVAFVGTLFDSPLSMERSGFEHLTRNKYANYNNYYAISGEEFYTWYYWQILGYPFNMVDGYKRSVIALDPDVRAMPTFPAEGCCQMRDGVLVIKVGNVYQGQ